MNPILLAVFLITLALVLYTVATLLNWRNKRLTVTHLVVLWSAITCDASATNLMAQSLPVIIWDMHTIGGYASLAIMVVLALYGTLALVQKREDRLLTFHKIFVPIWLIWVASYTSGVWLSMHRGG
jgi:uncharacterized repeat protein (TIGR03987 family)